MFFEVAQRVFTKDLKMSPANFLFRRIAHLSYHPIPAFCHPIQPFSTQTTTKLKSKSSPKTKQKYASSLYGTPSKSKKNVKSKTNPNTNSNDLYSSVSATDYDKDSNPTGWNATFHKAAALLDYSPFGTKSMMHSFNTLVTSYVCHIFI